MSKRQQPEALKAARKPPLPAMAPSSVRESVQSPGRELDARTRSSLEPRFGHDFSRVRVHTDAPASAKAVNAAAYTVGQHVVFDEGKYQPDNPEGQKLLVHELAHTIQQPQVGAEQQSLSLAGPADEHEREAERAASSAAGRGPVSVQLRRSTAVQRHPNPLPPLPNIDLAESASPLMASAIGSVTIDGFETGKADISKGNRAELSKTAGNIRTLLNRYPASVVRVIGHTDAIGKENDNLSLGQRRADVVQAALIEMGVLAEAIRTESKGETELLVKTDKAEPRNRRVQVRFETNQHRFTSFAPDVSLSLGEGEKKTDAGAPPKFPPRIPSDYNPPTTIPPYRPQDTGSNLPPWFWKPLPEGSKKPGVSLEGSIDAVAKKITSFLPKPIQGKAQELVKGAIEKGITSGLDAGLQAAGIDQNGRQAIGKAVEAAIKQKIGGSP